VIFVYLIKDLLLMPLLWLAENKSRQKFCRVLANGLTQIYVIAFTCISFITLIVVYLFFSPPSLKQIYDTLGAQNTTALIIYLAILYSLLEITKYYVNSEAKRIYARLP
jgi:hypothetical protein